MRYLSLFSGMEAATLAWHSLGWTCVAVAEVDPLARHIPEHYMADPRATHYTEQTENF